MDQDGHIGERIPTYVERAMELFGKYGSNEAIVYGERRLSYADLRRGVLEMAATLSEHGIAAGSAVAVLAGNSADAVLAQFALHLLGCRSVWIAPNAPPRLCVEYLRLAEVEAFAYDAATHADLGRQLADSAPHLTVFSLGPGGTGVDVTAPRPDGDPLPPALSTAALSTAEPQSLFQTGGTTGRPKLVHHRQSFFEAVYAVSERFQAVDGRSLRHLAVAGFWHSSSQTAAMMTIFTGGTLVLHDRFVVRDWLAAVERERITSAILPPPMLYQVLDHPMAATTDLSSLTMLSCGGSAAAPTRLAEAIDRFGTVLRPVYGMSEAPFIAGYPDLDHVPGHPERLGSCGKPYGDVRVQLRDAAGGLSPVGEIGEVWVRSSLMTSGYWGQPELTAATIVDGWLRTGDVGYFDADGFLFLVDRIKDMIVTGQTSTNVYSRTVEDALNAHPQVRAAAVVGVPHPVMGEAVHAFVVLTPPGTISAGDLREWAVGELNELWAPYVVQILAELPLTVMGKVDKKTLRAMASPQ